MKSLSVNVLDKADEEFADTLIQLGLKRNVAKVLTYLKNIKEVTSRDLEMGSDLRQPEVSIAMRELEELNWISEREEKKPGKGRPYKIYQLNTNIDTIINYLEKEMKKESQLKMDNIKRLKQLSK
ncbi:MAG: transcriptional regulator protein [Candidatus Methanoperedens sp.]|jgi:predicted transcriptional regulator|nr:transcriptional regulator protein [Candidatus Methanoperedens sp.]PKL53261.1 MAG: ArsR family transcriptional regulator [Candidatus Methanoperedenaceae archaeon HGW-Methanoperedenaceae-1]